MRLQHSKATVPKQSLCLMAIRAGEPGKSTKGVVHRELKVDWFGFAAHKAVFFKGAAWEVQNNLMSPGSIMP
jgi:hypothetical protein